LKLLRALPLAIITFLLALPAAAQCPAGLTVTDPRDETFKADQETTFSVDPSAAGIQGCMAQLQQSLDAWQNSPAGQAFGVRFRFTTSFADANVRIYAQQPPSDPSAPGVTIVGSWRAWRDPMQDEFGMGMQGATMQLSPSLSSCAAMQATFAHEVGHGFGLSDCYTCSGTVMQSVNASNPSANPKGPTACDSTVIKNAWDAILAQERAANSSPTGGGSTELRECTFCEDTSWTRLAPYADPLILDLDGDGIDLTSAADGVLFDVRKRGTAERVAWTVAGDDDAWLVYDRNANGTIDDSEELFGNFTRQPAGGDQNGYNALRLYDRPANGGNGDGLMDTNDRVWHELRAWRDLNHDGVSQPEELMSLSAARIERLFLDYKVSGKHDRNGNYFRYRAKVDEDDASSTSSRWTYDVFLRMQ
jgi:hypothetical protein